jgi:hypothetical protein
MKLAATAAKDAYDTESPLYKASTEYRDAVEFMMRLKVGGFRVGIFAVNTRPPQ